MRLAARLGIEWWAEAVNTAVYQINRLPTRALDGETPYRALLGKEAKLDHLRVFGCVAYVQIPANQREKLEANAWRGIMVGYDEESKCYRIYDPATDRVKLAVHVTFNEKEKPGVKLEEVQIDMEKPVMEPQAEQQQQQQQDQQQQQIDQPHGETESEATQQGDPEGRDVIVHDELEEELSEEELQEQAARSTRPVGAEDTDRRASKGSATGRGTSGGSASRWSPRRSNRRT